MRYWIIFLLSLVVLLSYRAVSGGFIRVEQPKFTILYREANIELRQYAPMLLVQLDVKGNQKQSLRLGFSQLAGYIFGKNQRNQKIAMTAPVMQEKTSEAWKIKFHLPSKLSMMDLPNPNNPELQFREQPAEKIAVIQFSGSINEEKLQRQQRLLERFLQQHHCQGQGLTYAFYNPPWTFPFLRRNELWLHYTECLNS